MGFLFTPCVSSNRRDWSLCELFTLVRVNHAGELIHASALGEPEAEAGMQDGVYVSADLGCGHSPL
jgi:hypothetical protein